MTLEEAIKDTPGTFDWAKRLYLRTSYLIGLDWISLFEFRRLLSENAFVWLKIAAPSDLYF